MISIILFIQSDLHNPSFAGLGMAAVVNWQISVFHIFPFFAPCIAIFSTMRYPSATSSTIITLKPTAKNIVPTFECCPCDISGISSSTTTYSMAPAAKLSR